MADKGYSDSDELALNQGDAIREIRRLAEEYDIRTIFAAILRKCSRADGERIHKYAIKLFAIDRNGLGHKTGQGPFIWLTNLVASAGNFHPDVDGCIAINDPDYFRLMVSQWAYGATDQVKLFTIE